MKGQPNRLVFDGTHLLGGMSIDRTRPLLMRLNDITIHGFAGDTVLSAALASGIDTAGTLQGWPMALSAQFAPAIVPVTGRREAPPLPLAMARTPATDGAEYRTLGPTRRSAATRLLGRLVGTPRSLDIDLDRAEGRERPWLTATAETAPASDVVVVGGGVAGLSAAAAAAQAGLTVTLVEATPHTGGHALLFGTQEGEEAPQQTILRLQDAVAREANITLRACAEAFGVRPGMVRAQVIETPAGHPVSRVVDFPARFIVVATGALERLPIFPGNRLPGIVGAADAYWLAHHYGVWPGRRFALATVSSPAYRLAMLARDAGIDVARIIDGRSNPQSRFIAFSKAYGITMAPGTIVAEAHAGPAGRGVAFTPQIALGSYVKPEPEVVVDRVVACGGWQPDLNLWHMVGGLGRWNAATGRIEPQGELPGIALAGSAGGFLTRQACVASGPAAVSRLLGRGASPVEDVLIDPMFETLDGTVPASAPAEEGGPPAYLGAGHSFLVRPRGERSRWPAWMPFLRPPQGWQLAETPQPLEITDITAGVQLGAIPPESAGIVAQERVAMSVFPQPAQLGPAPEAMAVSDMPSYLRGRFGASAELWLAAPVEMRRLDTGALVFASPDERLPHAAVGVVVRSQDRSGVVLVRKDHAVAGTRLSLREQGQVVTIRLVAPYRAGMDLAAALGGSSGAP